MDKTTLVYSEQGFRTTNATYEPMKPYRHLVVEGGCHMVFGEIHTPKDFAKDFKFWYDKVIADWKLLGLVNEDGTAISKTAFGKLLDLHQYGRGRTKRYIGYVRNSRTLIYQFFPIFGYTNKVAVLKDIYNTYLETVGGDMEAFDDKDIVFGNCGIPISYGVVKYQYYDKKATEDFVDELFASVKN
jgi:hypothetical protein